MESYYHRPWLLLMLPFQFKLIKSNFAWPLVYSVFQHSIEPLFPPRQFCAMGLYWPNHSSHKACILVAIGYGCGNPLSWLQECNWVSPPRACKEKRPPALIKDRWKSEFLWLSSWPRYRVAWRTPKTWMHICTVLNRGFLHGDRTERSSEAPRLKCARYSKSRWCHGREPELSECRESTSWSQ